jgi:hypothetical protein
LQVQTVFNNVSYINTSLIFPVSKIDSHIFHDPT